MMVPFYTEDHMHAALKNGVCTAEGKWIFSKKCNKGNCPDVKYNYYYDASE